MNHSATPAATRARHLAVVLPLVALAMMIVVAVGGTGAAEAGGASGPAKPTEAKPVQHTGPVPGGFASWNDLLATQEKMVRAAGRITAALEPDGDGYAGVVTAPENREIRLYWKGTMPRPIGDLVNRLRRDVPISVLPARYSSRELRQEASRLIRAAGGTLTSVTPLQDGSGLTASTATSGAARAVVAGAAVPVTLEHGVRPEPASRWDDSPPWWGGATWRTASGATCSTGLPVTLQNRTAILTAAHCANPGATATDPTGQVIGPVSGHVWQVDMSLIAADTAGRIYNNPLGNVTYEYGNPVIGTTPSTLGMYVCTSGASSGTLCNIRVVAVGVFLQIPSIPGGVLYNMVRAEQQAYTNALGGGDSGGPVEVVSSTDNTQVYAAGVAAAYDSGTTIPCTGYVTIGRVCGWRMYYSPWSNATAAYPGITIITG